MPRYIEIDEGHLPPRLQFRIIVPGDPRSPGAHEVAYATMDGSCPVVGEAQFKRRVDHSTGRVWWFRLENHR